MHAQTTRISSGFVVGLAMLVLLARGAPPVSAADEGYDRMKKHLEKIEDAQKEMTEVKKLLDKALDAYANTIRDGADDRRSSYKALVKWIDRCDERAEDLSKRHEEMDKEAKKYFEEWKKSTKDIENGDLKSRSQQRVDDTRSRFRELSDSWREMTKSLAPVTARLEDQAAYLDHDLNEQSVASLRQDSQKLDELVNQLQDAMLRFEQRAASYVGSLQAN